MAAAAPTGRAEPAPAHREGRLYLPVTLVRLLTLLALVLTAGAIVPGERSPISRGAGSLETVGTVRVVHLSGDPYEMGLQQGRLLSESIRELVSQYLYGRLVKSGAQHFWMLVQSRLTEPRLPPSIRSELHGIADGAGLSYRDVLLLNTVPDQLALAHTVPDASLLRGLFSPSLPLTGSLSLCTSFVGWGSATDNGQLLLGHNVENAEGDVLRDQLVLVVRQPRSSAATVSLGLAGSVGIWAGMNERSLAVTLASSPSVDVKSVGQPLPILLRMSLETSGDLETLVGSVVSADRQYGGNVIAADGKAPRAVAIELSAHQYALFDGAAHGGELVRTNHFVDSELSITQASAVDDGVKRASQERLGRVTDWMERNNGWIGVDKALAQLLDVSSWPEAGRTDSRTLQSILFVPADACLWLAQDAHSSPGTYSRLTFDELTGRRVAP